MADRIGIVDKKGKYVSSFDPGDARTVWYSAAHEHLYTLHCLRDGAYVWCQTTECRSGAVAKGERLSIVEAVERIYGLNEVPPDDLLRSADGELEVEPPFADQDRQSRRNIVTGFEHTTKQEFQIDTDASPKWGPIVYRNVTNDGFWKFTVVQTLYRRGERFILLIKRYDRECLGSPDGAKFLSNQEAADFLLRNDFEPPADIAHLATIRSVEEVTEEEIKAAGQPDAAKAQLTPDEELELLFPTGCASEPATEQAERPNTAAIEALPDESVAVEPAPASKVGGRVPLALTTDIDPEELCWPSKLAERFGLNLTRLNKALERWRAKHKAGGWVEVKDRKPNEPMYLYRLSAIMPLIDNMRAPSSEEDASSEMSA